MQEVHSKRGKRVRLWDLVTDLDESFPIQSLVGLNITFKEFTWTCLTWPPTR